MLVDLAPTGLDGKTAEDRLEEVGITVNRNAIPFDERPPMNPSGLRIGTPALTTRGLVEDDLREIADVVWVALSDRFEAEREALRERTGGAHGALPALPAARRRRGLTRGCASGLTAPPRPIRSSCGRSSSASRRAATTSTSPRASTARRPASSSASASPTRDRWRPRRASTAAKATALARRSAALARWARPRRFDLAIGHGSVDLAVVSTLLRVPSVQMQDYEHAGLQRQLAFRAARRVLAPDAIPAEAMRAAGAAPRKLFSYPGLKEDYYLADFEADPPSSRSSASTRERARRGPPAAGDLGLPRPNPSTTLSSTGLQATMAP